MPPWASHVPASKFVLPAMRHVRRTKKNKGPTRPHHHHHQSCPHVGGPKRAPNEPPIQRLLPTPSPKRPNYPRLTQNHNRYRQMPKTEKDRKPVPRNPTTWSARGLTQPNRRLYVISPLPSTRTRGPHCLCQSGPSLYQPRLRPPPSSTTLPRS